MDCASGVSSEAGNHRRRLPFPSSHGNSLGPSSIGVTNLQDKREYLASAWAKCSFTTTANTSLTPVRWAELGLLSKSEGGGC